jgi:GT2 family glycosyltransferase
MNPVVSIIVPVKKLNKNLKECIKYCKLLEYDNFEIIILPDNKEDVYPDGIKLIPTGNCGPSHKRDIALNHAKGEIIAFLDDDAYPVKDWLKNTVRYFEDEKVAAVGGPAVTPPSNSILQKASGLVYSSFICGGNLAYRYIPQAEREVDDYPSCNLIVRKSILEQLGGFDTKFWPGEDTKLCLEITKKLNKKIIYSPDILVYHHRRPLFTSHLKQVFSYALHRGYFVKRFPETSLRLTYFIPSIFVFGLMIGLIFALFDPVFRNIYLFSLGFYLICVFWSVLKGENLKIKIAAFWGIILTHIYYGIGFVVGLMSKRLKEEQV